MRSAPFASAARTFTIPAVEFRFFPIPGFDFIGLPLVLAVAVLLLAAETYRPLRRRVQDRFARLKTNNAFAAVAFLVIRLLLLPVVLAAAVWAHSRGIGLVKLLPVHDWVGAVIAFLLLDYTMYIWHRLNHRVGPLWRFHHVHHTDLDLDVSTAFRFHFGELLLSVVVRSVQVVLIGAGPVLVLVYEIALEAATEFHHSNLRFPIRLERALNRLIVTPRMHGIHHSVVRRETDSNYASVFSFWDRLHRTALLRVPQDELLIGVPEYRDPLELTFVGLMLMPFRRPRKRDASTESAVRKAGELAE